jgi:hypothetical protein
MSVLSSQLASPSSRDRLDEADPSESIKERWPPMTDTLTAMHPEAEAAEIERVLVGGDLSKLTPRQRIIYYRNLCESLSLNPLVQPFSYIVLNGKLVLYATRAATDQLASLRKISITFGEPKIEDGIYIVKASATDATGRCVENVGAVSVNGLKGDLRVNALLKAHTKASRRAILSFSGLGWLSEDEPDTIAGAEPVHVDPSNGDIVVTHTTGAQSPHPITGEITGPPPTADVPPPSAVEDKPVTQAQRKLLFALIRQKGLREEDLRSWLQLEYDTPHTSELTGAQMSRLLMHLKDATPAQLQDYLATLFAEAAQTATVEENAR